MPADPPSERVRCAVLGSPVAHSLSPVLHRAAYRTLGLDWSYDAVDVSEDALAGFLNGLSGSWRGLSLTMPLKRAVLELCDEVSDQARLLCSVNTVLIEPDGRRSGCNTDVTGFVRAFHESGVTALRSAVVLGAGATAASALAAVAELGADAVTVLARSAGRASFVAGLGPPLGLDVTVGELGRPPRPRDADVVVSTLPAGAQGEVATDALAALAPVVFDVVYAPARTPLMQAALSGGGTVIGGFALLLHQAVRQVELMTGADPVPVDAMRRAGLEALASS
jgi:shikimate dehydrogenase